VENRITQRQRGAGARRPADQTSRSLAGEIRRWAQLVLGLFLYGMASTLMIRSEFGLGPWDAFHVGLHRLTGISVGKISILVGVALVVGTWFIGVRPGPGTLANMVLIGVFIDLLLPIIPPATGWLRPGYHIASILLMGFATGLYIAAGLGKGPRDGTMLGIAERTGWSVRRVRIGIELTVLVLGWALGAKIGLGTVLFALGIGPATQWGLRIFGLLPTQASPGGGGRRDRPADRVEA
jgi:uncharacterized membrane protein YczE